MCTLGWFKDQWGLLDGCKKPRCFSWRVHAQACLLPLPAQRQQAENCLVCPRQLARATPVTAAVCTRALAPVPPAPALLPDQAAAIVTHKEKPRFTQGSSVQGTPATTPGRM